MLTVDNAKTVGEFLVWGTFYTSPELPLPAVIINVLVGSDVETLMVYDAQVWKTYSTVKNGKYSVLTIRSADWNFNNGTVTVNFLHSEMAVDPMANPIPQWTVGSIDLTDPKGLPVKT